MASIQMERALLNGSAWLSLPAPAAIVHELAPTHSAIAKTGRNN